MLYTQLRSTLFNVTDTSKNGRMLDKTVCVLTWRTGSVCKSLEGRSTIISMAESVVSSEDYDNLTTCLIWGEN